MQLDAPIEARAVREHSSGFRVARYLNRAHNAGGATARKANMNTIIRYRHWLYGAERTMPRLDSPKACPPPQAANEPRAANEQGLTPATREASRIEVFRQLVEDGLTSAEDIAREMDVSKGTVSKLAKRAMKEGWLKKQGRKYALA
jgi:DNA-binding NarL/FixJ family response regulator